MGRSFCVESYVLLKKLDLSVGHDRMYSDGELFLKSQFSKD